MKLIEFIKVYAQLNDAEIILNMLLKRQTLSPLDKEYFTLALERVTLMRAQLGGLLNTEQHWAISKTDKSKRSVFDWELNDSLVITQLTLESKILLEGLCKCVTFNNIFKHFVAFRNAFLELLITEHQFISDYQQISRDKPHLCNAIDKYIAQKAPSLTYNPTNSKNLLVTYDKARNCMAITYDELIRFMGNLLYGVEWIDSKIFGTTDFICFYEFQLLAWALAYTSLSEVFSFVKSASEDKRIALTAEEQSAINHVTNRLIGAVQRLGRYKLLLENIKEALEYIVVENILFIPQIPLTPPKVMENIIKFISTKNRMIEQTVGAVNFPSYLIDNLSALIRKLNEFVAQVAEGSASIPFFSSMTALEQGQVDCANSIITELDKMIILFKHELTNLKQSKPNQETLDLGEFNLFDIYSKKIRETIRTKFRQFESLSRGSNYEQLSKLPLYQLLDSYCQKIQPVSKEDRNLIAEQISKALVF
jgi:hypothetical protein